MSIYLAILDANNVVTDIVVAETNIGGIDLSGFLDNPPGIGDQWDPEHGVFIPQEIANPEPPPPHRPVRWITTLALDNRFTVPERVAIEIASEYEPGEPVQMRQVSATIRVLLARIDKATYVDLDRADTIEGIQTFEAFGLIAQGRAQEILSAPVQDIERPR